MAFPNQHWLRLLPKNAMIKAGWYFNLYLESPESSYQETGAIRQAETGPPKKRPLMDMFRILSVILSIGYLNLVWHTACRSCRQISEEISMKNEITVQKLLEPFETYQEGYEAISRKVDAGRLVPIKSSGSNGKFPPLYQRYRLPAGRRKRDLENLEQILAGLPIYFDPQWYRRHPAQLEKDALGIEKLVEYLESDPDHTLAVSENERSFQIWKREKFFNESGRRILKNFGVDPSFLNTYETIEPVTYFAAINKPSWILISENLDPFVTCRKILAAGNQSGILVYGSGKKILRSMQDLLESEAPFLKESLGAIYYLGDIDWQGIQIYESLAARYPQVSVRLFIPGYEAMIEKARQIGFEQMPPTKEGQKPVAGSEFFHQFQDGSQKAMRELLEKGLYIPQEILLRPDYERILADEF